MTNNHKRKSFLSSVPHPHSDPTRQESPPEQTRPRARGDRPASKLVPGVSITSENQYKHEIITNNHKPKSFRSLVPRLHRDPSPQKSLPERQTLRLPINGHPPDHLWSAKHYGCAEVFPRDTEVLPDMELPSRHTELLLRHTELFPGAPRRAQELPGEPRSYSSLSMSLSLSLCLRLSLSLFL